MTIKELNDTVKSRQNISTGVDMMRSGSIALDNPGKSIMKKTLGQGKAVKSYQTSFQVDKMNQ